MIKFRFELPQLGYQLGDLPKKGMVNRLSCYQKLRYWLFGCKIPWNVK